MSPSRRTGRNQPTLQELRRELADVRALASRAAAGLPAAAKAELERLRRENDALRAELESRDPGSSVSDLAAALRDSVDELQRTCAVTTNPVSDFAVREFLIQAN